MSHVNANHLKKRSLVTVVARPDTSHASAPTQVLVEEEVGV